MDDITRETEQTCRALQEAIDSTKQAIEQTLDLIEHTRSTCNQADPSSSGNVTPGAPIKRTSHKSGAT
jgi:hypothetical protein